MSSEVNSYIYHEVEAIPRQDIERLQLERLRSCIDRVSNTVPFYRQKLKEAGVAADSIRSLEDLDRVHQS